jgi:hypothetical protein
MTIEERKQQRYTLAQLDKWGPEIRHWQDGGEVEIGFDDGDGIWYTSTGELMFHESGWEYRIAQPKAREEHDDQCCAHGVHVRSDCAQCDEGSGYLTRNEWAGIEARILNDIEGLRCQIRDHCHPATAPAPRTITISEGQWKVLTGMAHKLKTGRNVINCDDTPCGKTIIDLFGDPK